MFRFSQTVALFFSLLVGALSLGRVSPDLHSSLFHGDAHCPHTSPCDSGESGTEKNGEDEIPCAVVLFGQGLEVQSHYQISAFIGHISNAEFSTVQLIWTSCKHDSFGARDPPVLA